MITKCLCYEYPSLWWEQRASDYRGGLICLSAGNYLFVRRFGAGAPKARGYRSKDVLANEEQVSAPLASTVRAVRTIGLLTIFESLL